MGSGVAHKRQNQQDHIDCRAGCSVQEKRLRALQEGWPVRTLFLVLQQEELRWLLREEVHSVLEDIQHTLQDLSIRQKAGKDTQNMHRTGIRPPEHWKLQQIQDAANHLQEAVEIAGRRERGYKFSSAEEVTKLLDSIMDSVRESHSSLSVPKRKSLYELVHSKNMQIFQPPAPQDTALSFYIHGCKVILGIYYLHTNGRHKLDITQRLQMECVVQWLNEAMICFTLALQQCQQLKDKIAAVCMFDGVQPFVNDR
ncbi:hypothetical protein BaRGS_00032321 [Batillaria attramentaria]|uniref:Uncharacterized protein n=1 Tax=Batillaria attramentaria TaxID=370345 RepID=A0ABD0JNM4_9CAEN